MVGIWVMEDSTKILEDDIRRAVEQAKELHDMAAYLMANYSNDEQLIRQRAASLDSTISRIKSTIDSQSCRKLLDPHLSEKFEDELQKAECIMVDGDAYAFLPPKPEGRFLRMFLGPISVRAIRKDIQLKVKVKEVVLATIPDPDNAKHSLVLQNNV